MFVEMTRNGVTKGKFNSDLRFALKKAGFENWVSWITLDSATLKTSRTGEPYHIHTHDVDAYVAEEIVTNTDGHEQTYCKYTDGTGYNFIYEFTYDDGKTGTGYAYIAEF